MKTLSILGSTGSIGRSCLKVIAEFPDDFRVAGLAAGSNTVLLAEQIERFQPQIVSVSNLAAKEALDRCLRQLHSRRQPRIVTGLDGLTEVAIHPETDLVVSAIVGVQGLLPTFAAIECGKTIALANKEIMVVAGDLVMAAAKRNRVEILPVDSEHNAIHQCLRAGRREEVRQVILTASGGPFRSYSRAMLDSVTPAMALNHPTWRMGPKVTIDSATLANKGYEVIEARWLYDLAYERIDVVLHPQSIVHALGEYVDGSVKAQLAAPDMRLPIQNALLNERHLPGPAARLDLVSAGRLDFRAVEPGRYPCLEVVLGVARSNDLGAMIGLSAADEVAVERFLAGDLEFLAIADLLQRGAELGAHLARSDAPGLAEIFAIDAGVRTALRAVPASA